MSESYDPNSQNAMLSRIIERLDKQDASSRDWREEIFNILSEIRTETRKTNDRVSALEQWHATLKANRRLLLWIGSGAASMGAGIATVGMWLLDHFAK